MAIAAQEHSDHVNPIDKIEQVAEKQRWSIDRTSDDEVLMHVTGGWCDLNLSLNWRSDLEALSVACTFDLRVPEKRRNEITELVARMNAQLVYGHFDFWGESGFLMFRNSLMLTGGADLNDLQCEAMIRTAIESCQRYYPAIQFVIWAGYSAEQALGSALLETHGEA